MKMTPAELNALLRTDLYTFIVRAFRELNPETKFLHNWHIEKIADELEKCRRGECEPANYRGAATLAEVSLDLGLFSRFRARPQSRSEDHVRQLWTGSGR